ncbi:hypothetical protein CIB48_g3188 [Xylaria polymorpha]|nr:hypothetical protein CIB48_g3188 [Xylaria polymorpha]
MAGANTDKQVARQLKQIQDASAKQFHENLKRSLLLKDEMPDFLSSAPLVINFLGHLRLLAWSKAATVDMVRGKDSSFKSDKLSVNLIRLCQQGHNVFQLAHENMNSILEDIQGLFGESGEIFGVIHCLTDLSAQSSLQERMDSLASGMGECAHLANAIWNETKTWRDMVAELEQATNSEYGLASFGLVALASITNPIRETIHHATTFIGKAPGLIENLSHPTIGLGSMSNDDSQPQQTPTQGSMGQQQVVVNPNVVTNEVAYTKAYAISTLVSDLQSLSEDDLANSKTELRDLQGQADQLRRDVQPSSKPSRDACHIIDDCRKIITEMRKEGEGSISLNGASSSDKRWTARLEKLKAEASGLELEADAQPGQAFGDVSVNPIDNATTYFIDIILKQVPILNPETFIRDNGTIDVNAFLNRRREDHARKEFACAAALSNYEKMAEKHAANQREIIRIAHKLERLHTGEVTTGELTKLTLYFSNIKAVLELLRKNECQRFTREIRYALNEATPQKGVAFDEIQAQVSCP